MAIDQNIARAARNLITEHGDVAETVALARAKHAEESNRAEVARTWRNIAAAVRRLQGRQDRQNGRR
jgi:hypothetical protein